LRGDVEVALVTTAPESASLCVEPYRREQMVAFVSVNHPLASKERLSLAEILCQPLVVRAERGLHGTILKILREYEREGFKMNVAMRCESPDAVKAAVRKKAGVGFLYKDLLKTDSRTRDFKILKAKGLKLDARSFVIYHKERALSANAGDFLKILYRQRRNRANEAPSSPVG
jgi:DNA-binding transcriptional LysR family regulator